MKLVGYNVVGRSCLDDVMFPCYTEITLPELAIEFTGLERYPFRVWKG